MTALLALVLLLATAWPAVAADAPAEITLATVMIEDRKAVFATVQTVRRTMARTRIGGTVGELSVAEGDSVRAGQRIAAIGDPKLAMQLDANDQRMRQAEAQRDQARIDHERARALFASGNIAQARLDQSRTALDVAERAVSALRAERGVTGERMAESAVLAPVSGRVLQVPVSLGQVVMPGETVAAIATERFILRAEIPERHARFLARGDNVAIGDTEEPLPLGLQGKTLTRHPPGSGIITKIYPEIRDGKVTADIAVEGLGDFFVGERVRVWLATGRRPGLVLPPTHLSRRFGLTFARLVDGTEVLVQPGRPVEGGIEILSGLRDGDVVVAP